MRSKYIYLVYLGDMLMAAFTVKHEAHTWAERSEWSVSQLTLTRMEDGVSGDRRAKPSPVVPWDESLFKLGDKKPIDRLLIKAGSEVDDWPDWAKNVLG